MKKIITSLLLASVLMSCDGKKKTYNDNLGIAERVEIKENENYIQFPDSKVFMVMPEGFELNESQVGPRVRIDKRNFIEVTEEYNNRSIDEMKEAFENTVDDIKKKRASAFCKIQDFKLGDYDARFIYISNLLPGIDKATLIFGNDKYSVALGSSFENEHPSVKRKIMDAMLTAYIDLEAKPDHTSFANYTIDLTGTKYKFNSFKNSGGLLINIYTADGYDLEYTPEGNNFMIMEIPDSTKSTAESRKEMAITIADGMSKDSLVTTFRQERFITINDEDVYEIITDKKYGDKKIMMETYLLCFAIGDKTLVLVGYMFTDFKGTIATYRHIAETMKLK